jgi:hypothetical protein
VRGEICASYSFISAARNPVSDLRIGIAGTDLLGLRTPRNAATNTEQALSNAAKFATKSESQATNCDFDAIFVMAFFAIDCCRSARAKLDAAGRSLRR